jgi:tRNA(fMet)-specific endonuclease VapC
MRGNPSIVSAMSAQSPTDLALSSVTSYELYTRVSKCAAPDREHEKVVRLLNTLIHIDFDLQAARAAARIRADLESRGEMIGPYDVLLAGQAFSRGLIRVSDNISEFARIIGLVFENWQSP